MAIILDPKRERTEDEKRRFEEILQNGGETEKGYATMLWKMGAPIEHIEASCKKDCEEKSVKPTGKMSHEEIRRRMNRNAVAYMAFNEEDF